MALSAYLGRLWRLGHAGNRRRDHTRDRRLVGLRVRYLRYHASLLKSLHVALVNLVEFITVDWTAPAGNP